MEDWSVMDEVDVWAYVGVLPLVGVYRSWGETTRSLWKLNTSHAMVRTFMLQKKFKHLGRTISSDDQLIRHSGRLGGRTIWLSPNSEDSVLSGSKPAKYSIICILCNVLCLWDGDLHWEGGWGACGGEPGEKGGALTDRGAQGSLLHL